MPIVKSEIEHKSAIFYGQKAKVFVKLIPTPAAKMIFEYEGSQFEVQVKLQQPVKPSRFF